MVLICYFHKHETTSMKEYLLLDLFALCRILIAIHHRNAVMLYEPL